MFFFLQLPALGFLSAADEIGAHTGLTAAEAVTARGMRGGPCGCFRARYHQRDHYPVRRKPPDRRAAPAGSLSDRARPRLGTPSSHSRAIPPNSRSNLPPGASILRLSCAVEPLKAHSIDAVFLFQQRNQVLELPPAHEVAVQQHGFSVRVSKPPDRLPSVSVF